MKTAVEKFGDIVVHNDYSQATRKLIKVLIEKTTTTDGEQFERLIYTLRGPGSHLEVQKKKMIIENKSTKETAFEET